MQMNTGLRVVPNPILDVPTVRNRNVEVGGARRINSSIKLDTERVRDGMLLSIMVLAELAQVDEGGSGDGSKKPCASLRLVIHQVGDTCVVLEASLSVDHDVVVGLALCSKKHVLELTLDRTDRGLESCDRDTRK